MAPKKSKKDQDEYAYKLVLFPDDTGEKLSIDVAPAKWITFSDSLKSYACPFPLGPFDKEQIAQLHKRIKNSESPDKSWPVHRVIIHGRARTYTEACKATAALEYEPYAFSTDGESSIERTMHKENHVPEKNKKTLDEELAEARCDLTPHVSTRKTKPRGPAMTQHDPEKLSREQSSRSSSESSSSDRSRPVRQKFEYKKPAIISSSHSSSSEDLSSKELSIDELVGDNSSSRKSTAAGSPKSTKSLPKEQDPKTLLKTPPSTNSTPEIMKRRDNKHRNQSASNKSVTSPSQSSTPQKGSTKSRLRDTRPCSAEKRQKFKDSCKKSMSELNFHNPSESGTGKRYYSSSSDDDTENVQKKTKIDRRSRSRERRRLQGDGAHQRSDPKDASSKDASSSNRRSSEGPRILDRSISVESYREPRNPHKHRRTQSTEAERPQSHNSSSSGTNSLPPLEEAQSFKSVRDDMKRMFSSIANRIDRVHGAQVESDGKLDQLLGMFNRNPPAQQDSDDGDDLNDPNAIILPTQTKDQFIAFDAKLKAEKDYARKIKKRIRNMVPKPTQKYGTHDLSVIVRVFLSKKLVTETFVALKATGGKDALKETHFYKCLLTVHQEVRGDEMSEKAFQGHLKNMFNAAGDWDGGRALRR